MGIRYFISEVAEPSDGAGSGYHSFIKIANFCIFRGMGILILLTYLLTYLITYLFTYYLTYLLTHLLNYLLTHLLTYLLTY